MQNRNEELALGEQLMREMDSKQEKQQRRINQDYGSYANVNQSPYHNDKDVLSAIQRLKTRLKGDMDTYMTIYDEDALKALVDAYIIERKKEKEMESKRYER